MPSARTKQRRPDVTAGPRRALARLAEPWRAAAACADVVTGPDDDVFFDSGREHEALAVCRRCPVVDECLAYALTAREPKGVWGGRTSRQRNAILRLHRTRAATSAAGLDDDERRRLPLRIARFDGELAAHIRERTAQALAQALGQALGEAAAGTARTAGGPQYPWRLDDDLDADLLPCRRQRDPAGRRWCAAGSPAKQPASLHDPSEAM